MLTLPRTASAPPELKEAQKELERVTKEKEAAINDQDYEVAANLRDAEAIIVKVWAKRSTPSCSKA